MNKLLILSVLFIVGCTNTTTKSLRQVGECYSDTVD